MCLQQYLSHVDAGSDVPLGMPVTQLCNSSYRVEPCIFCQCGRDHFKGIGKSSVNTDNTFLCWVHMMKLTFCISCKHTLLPKLGKIIIRRSESSGMWRCVVLE